jgi:Icc-related predicted phosphoesterase
MRIQVVSDLHTEFYTVYNYARFFEPEGIDVLVLAGDIGVCGLDVNGKNVFDTLIRNLCTMYPNVVYVEGNHEYYGKNIFDVRRTLTDLSLKIENFHWLDNSDVTIQGQRFIGGSMWFPVPSDPLWIFHKKLLNDFEQIEGDFANYAFNKNSEFRAFYNMNVKPSDIVVSHYLPSDACVPTRFKNNTINCFFVSDMDEYFDRNKKPRIWIHGHTHDALDIEHYGFRIVCNPIGYFGEYNSNIADRIGRKIIEL